MDLEGPMHWIWKDFNGFGGSQALDLEGFRWIWRVPDLGFRMISMDLEGPRPWIWKDFSGFGRPPLSCHEGGVVGPVTNAKRNRF